MGSGVRTAPEVEAKIVKLLESGKSRRSAARIAGVSINTVYRIAKTCDIPDTINKGGIPKSDWQEFDMLTKYLREGKFCGKRKAPMAEWDFYTRLIKRGGRV